MYISPYKSGIFLGWNYIQNGIKAVGPERTLRVCINHAYRDVQIGGKDYSDSLINYHNLPLIALGSAKLWSKGEGNSGTEPLTPVSEGVLVEIFQGISDRAQHRLLNSKLEHTPPAPSLERTSLIFWFNSLQMRYRALRTADEYARTWRIFRSLWDQGCYRALSQRSKLRKDLPNELPTPLASSFDSMEFGLFLRLALLVHRGWIGDYRVTFSNTQFGEGIDEIIEHNTADVSEYIPEWEVLTDSFETSLKSHLIDQPILRVGRTLFAPDPMLLFSAFGRQIFIRVRQNSYESGDSIGEVTRTVVGYAFEDYINELLEELASLSHSETYKNEFNYTTRLGNSSDSPDGLLLSDNSVTLFEAKAGLLSEPPDDVFDLNGLLDQLAKLGGRRQLRNRVRPALEQGYDFFNEWINECPDIEQQIKPLANRSTSYVLVGQVPLPPLVHNKDFREQIWHPVLDEKYHSFLEKVYLLEVQDLEVLVSYMRLKQKKGNPSSVHSTLQEWRAYGYEWLQRMKPGIGQELTPSLKLYLMTQEPSLKSDVAVLEKARSEAFVAAGRLGFGPVQWREFMSGLTNPPHGLD